MLCLRLIMWVCGAGQLVFPLRLAGWWWGETHNKATNSVSIMMTAISCTYIYIYGGRSFISTSAVIWIWQFFCCFFSSCRNQKASSQLLHNNLQTLAALHVYSFEMTRSVASTGNVAGCHIVPGMEIKPKGCSLNPCMPTEQRTWRFARPLSINQTESQPLTGCDLDRWTSRHVLFITEKVEQQCATLLPSLKP